MKIQLQNFGEITCVRPPLSICFDVVSMFSEMESRHHRGRICAVAICFAVDHPKFPTKRTSFDLMDYGSKCLDFLLGADVPINQIFQNGLELVTWFAESLPSEIEVKEVENFSE